MGLLDRALKAERWDLAACALLLALAGALDGFRVRYGRQHGKKEKRAKG
ncbi:MAG: hypothetical protein N2506_04015 [Dehalococcoidales bacterium]|nr:hypothetical protein [Dehalococcoidales bacterium]